MDAAIAISIIALVGAGAFFARGMMLKNRVEANCKASTSALCTSFNSNDGYDYSLMDYSLVAWGIVDSGGITVFTSMVA